MRVTPASSGSGRLQTEGKSALLSGGLTGRKYCMATQTSRWGVSRSCSSLCKSDGCHTQNIAPNHAVPPLTPSTEPGVLTRSTQQRGTGVYTERHPGE